MKASGATRELLARLVGFDTTTRNSNIGIIAFIEDYLGRHGVASLRVDYEAGNKTNLYATIGPDGPGGIVLSAHTDVVPVDGQEWSTDPFSATEKDGLVYGRGTADMKGFLAAALAAVPRLKARVLKRPVHLAISCDEEIGCLGVRPLIAHMRAHLPTPLAVIVGEPTLMQVVDAHKAVISFQTEVTGHEAHSSVAHTGVNAVMVAGELLGELNRLAAMMRARADPDSPFDPPYMTVHVGDITGGTAKNIVPRRCSFGWETRLMPNDDAEEVPATLGRFAEGLLPAMRRVAENSGIVTRHVNSVPGLNPDAASPALELALRLAQANRTSAVSYATEAGLFQQAGIPAIICGPGSIDQAHKPDEFVASAELARCELFLDRLGEYCAN
ncbi:MAG: acetylornithine deacetylase [Pseudomonadota bacterium]|nr:acetylornithine deacetylase [Pseudomonadota bacterium]